MKRKRGRAGKTSTSSSGGILPENGGPNRRACGSLDDQKRPRLLPHLILFVAIVILGLVAVRAMLSVTAPPPPIDARP